MTSPAVSISELNLVIRDWIDAYPPLADIWVTGEIKNFRRFASGGHLYFTLSDAESTIQCVAFDAAAARLDMGFKDGMAVMARGKVRYFNRKGTLQFQINYMIPKGTGDLFQNLELLKQKLAAEGLFDPLKKQSLPLFPTKIAVITAADSAALADVVKVLGLQAPAIDILIVPSVMQGLGCAPSVCDAIKRTLTRSNIDLILITRGGGSAEDLLPFSDESLLRQISQSPIPIVTAIGHDTDSTLSDLVADISFPTPSAAAAAIAQGHSRLPDILTEIRRRLSLAMDDLITETEAMVLREMAALHLAIDELVRSKETQITHLFRELDLLSPLRKLALGFSITRLENGQLLTSVSQIISGSTVTIQLNDGVLHSKVDAIYTHAT
jgi:exodeoxyribonuclease VII large subunit